MNYILLLGKQDLTYSLKLQKAIDKAVQHGQLHKNTAARKKSRLMAKVNTLK